MQKFFLILQILTLIEDFIQVQVHWGRTLDSVCFFLRML